jgi:cytochrome c peroxidase
LFIIRNNRDFTANESGMLSIKLTTAHPLQSLSRFITIISFSVINTAAQAENTDNYRQEAIFPIPLKVEVDTDMAELGETLFFDTRLSSNGKLACASCHQLDNGGDDNMAMGISSSAEKHFINTPSIFNARYNFRQNWDGSMETLEQQIDMVMSNNHEFNNNWNDVISTLLLDDDISSAFNHAFNDGITRNNIIAVIVEFEKTLITPNSRFDYYLRNEEVSADVALNEEEIEGYQTFKELGCISCHQGINIGGNLYQKFGVFYNYLAERGDLKVADFGRMNITDRQMDAFVFKVPSLRNIAVTAPYLHDGSAETMEQVIGIMGKTQLGRNLSKKEIRLIKAFLMTLTGEYKNKPLDAAS